VLQAAEVVVLAVKPESGAGSDRRDPRWDYVVAFDPFHCGGVTLARLEEALPEGTRVVRVMPNTPALVGASATAYAPGRAARSVEDSQLVHRLFIAVGSAK
jgi:pyrroline-5-carboxylate reductase